MKLIIELDVDSSDFSVEEAKRFLVFSMLDSSTGVNVEISGQHDTIPEAFQMMSLGTEYFKVRIEGSPRD